MKKFVIVLLPCLVFTSTFVITSSFPLATMAAFAFTLVMVTGI